jgi:hypothetical protein
VTYHLIDSFRAGLDVRRPSFSAPPGTISKGDNVHLTKGGDLEQRKAFVKVAALPSGTFGLASVGGLVSTFGSQATPTGMPANFGYTQLTHPTGASMTSILDIEYFNGKTYVIADFNNDTRHFYNGARVTDFDGPAGAVSAPYFPGKAARTIGSKVYSVSAGNLFFSTIDLPTSLTGTGAGFVNVSNHSAGCENLIGLELYYDTLLVMAKDAMQVWHVEANSVNNARTQTFPSVGLVAPRASVCYLDGAAFWLSYQGVKSIQAKFATSRNSLADVSSQIDPELTAYMKTLDTVTLGQVRMLIEPEDNRLWLVIGNRIYVRSWFPTDEVIGWTTYYPGFTIDDIAIVNRRVYARSGNDVYLYGGESGSVYDACPVVIRLPHGALSAPATFKGLQGIDVGVEGKDWSVYMLFDPRDPTNAELSATISGETFDGPQIPVTGVATHIGLELRRSRADYGRFCNVALHFALDEAN